MELIDDLYYGSALHYRVTGNPGLKSFGPYGLGGSSTSYFFRKANSSDKQAWHIHSVFAYNHPYDDVSIEVDQYTSPEMTEDELYKTILGLTIEHSMTLGVSRIEAEHFHCLGSTAKQLVAKTSKRWVKELFSDYATDEN